jgi:hypothetical protein
VVKGEQANFSRSVSILVISEGFPGEENKGGCRNAALLADQSREAGSIPRKFL